MRKITSLILSALLVSACAEEDESACAEEDTSACVEEETSACAEEDTCDSGLAEVGALFASSSWTFEGTYEPIPASLAKSGPGFGLGNYQQIINPANSDVIVWTFTGDHAALGVYTVYITKPGFDYEEERDDAAFLVVQMQPTAEGHHEFGVVEDAVRRPIHTFEVSP